MRPRLIKLRPTSLKAKKPYSPVHSSAAATVLMPSPSYEPTLPTALSLKTLSIALAYPALKMSATIAAFKIIWSVSARIAVLVLSTIQTLAVSLRSRSNVARMFGCQCIVLCSHSLSQLPYPLHQLRLLPRASHPVRATVFPVGPLLGL